jgi:hypothetical protein
MTARTPPKSDCVGRKDIGQTCYFYQPERMVVGGYVLMIPVMLARKYFS